MGRKNIDGWNKYVRQITEYWPIEGAIEIRLHFCELTNGTQNVEPRAK